MAAIVAKADHLHGQASTGAPVLPLLSSVATVVLREGLEVGIREQPLG
jgi:hypothetical protein